MKNKGLAANGFARPGSLVFSFACLAALVACSPPEVAPEPVRSVKVVKTAYSHSRSGQEFAGEVRARVESQLGFRVGGKVISRSVQAGQSVKAGQVLAQIDPQDYQLASQAAAAQVGATQANRDVAAADLQRFTDLKNQGFISSAELDRRSAALKTAQAQLDQARSQQQLQGHQGDYTTLRADLAGVVTFAEIEPGQVVAAGTPVIRIAQNGPRDVVFAVPENQWSRFSTGTAVQVRSWGQSASLSGTVRERGASADPVTRTFSVKVALPPAADWPLGSTATVLTQNPLQAQAPTIQLPTSALRQDGKGSAVWVLDPNTLVVSSVPVKVSSADLNEAIISEGLKPDMLVVSTGVHVLTAGQKVSLYRAPSAAAAPAVAPGASAVPTKGQ